MKQNWYEQTTEAVLDALHTTTDGLTEKEAFLRLQQYGANTLPVPKPTSLAVLFFKQFTSPLVYILLIVAVVVAVLGEAIDAGVIGFILFFNAVIGTIQEGRAQNTLAALKRFVQTQARVLREGKELLLPDSEVVPGDVLVLREGDKIAADGRLLSVSAAMVNESSLTGESASVAKVIEPIILEDAIPLSPADQRNMVFKGTSLVAGQATMVVTATGTATQIGTLSKTIAAGETEIPLQKNIRALSHLIVAVVAVISVILFGVGILRGLPAVDMIATVVSLAVSLIPEGLPVVITLILANGVWQMSQRKALVKRLGAVEALGQTNVIAVDKTGTITRNELVVVRLVVNGKTFEVTGRGYEPTGEVLYHKQAISVSDFPELAFAGKVAAFANADLLFDRGQNRWVVAGDPTEAAMLVFAEKMGFKKEDMHERHPIIQVIPFDYKRKYRATVFKDKLQQLVVMGAPEVVAALSNVSEQAFLPQLQELSREGLRVIAFAVAQVDSVVDPDAVPQLSFGGLFGLQDSLHAEVPSAVADVQEAGIHTIMITGDFKDTAQAIAQSAGIYRAGDAVMTGKELDALSDSEVNTLLERTTVFARITPENKLRIVKAFQKQNKVIAMTGDGVNDVPSLVAADLGIAMGQTGTDVTKESADIVLLDDNFTTIAAAVEEGRNIYHTIKRALLYLFSTSIGELFVIAGALFLGWPLPVTAVQILWLNFVTDGFLTVSFAFEPKEGNLLRRSFDKPTKYIIDGSMVRRMIPMGAIMSIGTLALFYFYKDFSMVKANTIAVTVLAVYQWFNAWNARSETRSAFRSMLSNRFLIAATVIVIVMHVTAVHTAFGNKVLDTVPLTLPEWGMILLLASSIIWYEELVKFIKRRKK